jgi:hypothetical protein
MTVAFIMVMKALVTKWGLTGFLFDFSGFTLYLMQFLSFSML